MTYAVDGEWSCSRCQSFGRIRPDQELRCECDEVEDSLREQLAAANAEIERLKNALEIETRVGETWRATARKDPL